MLCFSKNKSHRLQKKGIPGRTKAMVPDYMEHPCMELDVREWPAPPVKTSMGERWAEWKTEKENERWADPLTSPLDPPLSIQIPWETDSHAPGPHHKHMLISALQIGWHGKENTHTHTHRVLESWIPTPQSTFDALHGLSFSAWWATGLRDKLYVALWWYSFFIISIKRVLFKVLLPC